jgi:superfamily I DNA/RNA helicase
MELQAAQIPCDTFKMAGKTAQELHDIVESNSVKVLTIHTSKGLEAKNVIVIGTRNKGYDEEENRLNYVAATRAKKRLFWTYPTPKPRKKKESNGTKNWER